jgi:hypothetical protein
MSFIILLFKYISTDHFYIKNISKKIRRFIYALNVVRNLIKSDDPLIIKKLS